MATAFDLATSLALSDIMTISGALLLHPNVSVPAGPCLVRHTPMTSGQNFGHGTDDGCRNVTAAQARTSGK